MNVSPAGSTSRSEERRAGQERRSRRAPEHYNNVPATTEATPSVLVAARSATRVTSSVSVPVLLPGTSSVVPAGGDTVALLVRVLPAKSAATPTVTVKLSVPVTGASVVVV